MVATGQHWPMGIDLVAVNDPETARQLVGGGALIVVFGADGEAVGTLVGELNEGGPGRAAGFVGTDLDDAKTFGDEVFARG